MTYKYSTTVGEQDAKAVGISLEVSARHGKEVCKAIRDKPLATAKAYLSEVIEFKRAVPFRKHDWDLAHKKGIGPGRYPIKTCKAILEMLESAEANAQFKGLTISDLHVKHVSAQKAGSVARGGRRRAEAKRTHIEVVLTERKQATPVKKEKKAAEKPKEEKKPEPAKEKPVKTKKETPAPKAEEKPAMKEEPKGEEKKVEKPAEEKKVEPVKEEVKAEEPKKEETKE